MTPQDESKQIIDQDQDYLNKFHEDELLTKIKNIVSEGTLETEDQRTRRITRTLLWVAKLITSVFKRERMRSDTVINLGKELNDLSKTSAKQTETLIRLTRWLIVWTIILAIFTLTLLFKDLGIFTKFNQASNSRINDTTKSDKK